MALSYLYLAHSHTARERSHGKKQCTVTHLKASSYIPVLGDRLSRIPKPIYVINIVVVVAAVVVVVIIIVVVVVVAIVVVIVIAVDGLVLNVMQRRRRRRRRRR